MKTFWRYPLLILFLLPLLAACGAKPPSSSAKPSPPATRPINKVSTGYIANYAYAYPANWKIQPSLPTKQYAGYQTVMTYGSVITATLQEFPSYIDTLNAASGGNIPLSSAIPLISAGVQLFASSSRFTASSPSSITILQNTGLYYTLTSNSRSAGSVGVGFSNGSELILTCTWKAPYATIGQQACPSILGSLTTSTAGPSSGPSF